MRSSVPGDKAAGRQKAGRAEPPREKKNRPAPGVLALIPARWASARFPGKPLHPIAGKPLVQHVWERCREARAVDRVAVATDDARIARAVEAFGGEAVMTSPRHASGTDRIAEAARRFPGMGWVLNVQGDEPLIDPRLIDALVRAIRRSGDEMATAATPFLPGEPADDPNAVKVVRALDGRALYFSRSPIPYPRQPPETPPLRHIGIYAYRRDFLLKFVRWGVSPLETCEQLEQLRALQRGASVRVILADAGAPGVDTPEDAARAETLFAARAAATGGPGKKTHQ